MAEPTEYPNEIPGWELDHERELAEIRDRLDERLATAQDAVRRAAQDVADLIARYDVEIAEGPGTAAPEALAQVGITLAGVRAVTVDLYKESPQ